MPNGAKTKCVVVFLCSDNFCFVLLACQQKLKQNRATKILALVPRSHTLSETSDTEIEHEVHERISSSSPSPSLDSSFERMHLLSSSSNDDDINCTTGVKQYI